MGQYWCLANFDSEEATPGGGKLGESFCHDPLFVDIRYFAIPTWSDDRLHLLHRKYPRTAHRSNSPASLLLRLSDELISMIFGHVDQLVDAAYFCLTDGRLLAIGFSQIGELQKLKFAPWAGDRVVCLGEYTNDDDYPSGLQEDVNEWLRDDDSNSSNHSNSKEGKKSSEFLETVLFRHFTVRRYPPSVYLEDDRYFEVSRTDHQAFEFLASPEYKTSNSYSWILCNLSKRVYVRAEAIASITKDDFEAHKASKTFSPAPERRHLPLYPYGTGHVNGPSPLLYGPITLGQVLLSRICWSSDSSTSMSYEGNLHRGPWAGDRFEVTTTDKLQGTEWKDISTEMSELLPKIWDAEYGNDFWRTRGYDID